MPEKAHRDRTSLREACTAVLYGLDVAFRHGDAFDEHLAAICDWVVRVGPYERASVDVFTGSGVRTLAGDPPPAAVLEVSHRALSAAPGRLVHVLPRLPHVGTAVASSVPRAPISWAGAALRSPTGAALGGVNAWSAAEVGEADVHGLLPILARAAMQVLEDRRRVLTGRRRDGQGPRPVVDRE